MMPWTFQMLELKLRNREGILFAIIIREMRVLFLLNTTPIVFKMKMEP